MRHDSSNQNPSGYCMCGCGEKTTVSPCDNIYYGYRRGVPRKFVHGHSAWTEVKPVEGRATDHAWAAGIIDGEGSIFITTSWDKRWINGNRGTSGKAYRQSVLQLSVSQSGFRTPPMLIKLQSLFGGSIGGPSDGPGRRRPIWRWNVAARKAEATLLSVRPYLVEKREQAEIALAFRRNAQGVGKAELVHTYAEALKAAKRH